MNYLEAGRRLLLLSEFKVGGTHICTTAYYMHYKIFYRNTIFYKLTWGYNAVKKTAK